MYLFEIIELLECAKINVNNIRKGGLMFVDLSIIQLDKAILELKIIDNAEK